MAIDNSRLTDKALNRRTEKYVKFTLTNAQILALNATPITVIPAPGAGLVTVVERVYATKIAGTAYTIGSNAGIDFKYTNGSGTAVVTALLTTGFLDQATAQVATTDAASASIIGVTNAVIVAQSKTAEVTGAGPAVQLRIYFRTLPAAL